jgi:MYXO-CTERM domain-containing protein
MMLGFLSKPAHRPWPAAIFGLLLLAGLLVWIVT